VCGRPPAIEQTHTLSCPARPEKKATVGLGIAWALDGQAAALSTPGPAAVDNDGTGDGG
jgi:hypothetical protein